MEITFLISAGICSNDTSNSEELISVLGAHNCSIHSSQPAKGPTAPLIYNDAGYLFIDTFIIINEDTEDNLSLDSGVFLK